MKTLLTVATAALLAFGLLACGGGDDDSTSAPTATAPSGGGNDATNPTPGDADRDGNEKQAGDDKGGSPDNGDSSSGDAESSGGSGAGEGSDAFRTPGGDNSIQDYGDEADSDQREAAEASIVAYLDARAAGNWAESCEYLATAAVEPLEQLAESSPQLKGKGCAAIIGALSAQLPASSRANPVTEGIASLRFEDERGFALFHGRGGVDFFLPVVEEDGEWKVGALAPSEFP